MQRLYCELGGKEYYGNYYGNQLELTDSGLFQRKETRVTIITPE